MKDYKLHNKKKLRQFRSDLRNNSTSVEAVLWNLLKNKNLKGRKFRRRHSFGNIIVDFYCPSEMLIIELDGEVHGDYFKIEEDTRRDENLQKPGFKVLRFENRIVLQEPEFMLMEISKLFNQPPCPSGTSR